MDESRGRASLAALCALLLVGCAEEAGETLSSPAVVGPEGAVVSGAGGTTVAIPAGALSEEVTITITEAQPGQAPALSALPQGAVLALEPHGQTFAQPVTVSIPHHGNPTQLALYTAEPGDSDWSKIRSGVSFEPNVTRAQVMHFSFFYNGREVCGLARQACCDPADGMDGACSGDALACIDGRCIECGMNGDPCCGGACLDGSMCCTSSTGDRCVQTDDCSPDAMGGSGGTP